MSLFKSVKVINFGKAILLSRKYGIPLRYHSTWLQGCYADKDGHLSTILTKAL